MTDLGKGDVVVATTDMSVGSMWTGHGPYVVKAGQRAIVAAVVAGTSAFCTSCGKRPDLVGLLLEEYPLRPGVYWCPCEWKKLGPSKEETVARFAHHLTPARTRAPARVG